MPIYLGIDGGATKTQAAIATDEHVLAMAMGGGTNLVRSSKQSVRIALHGAIAEACRKAGIKAAQVDCICMGAAGVSDPANEVSLREMLAEIVHADAIIVGDMKVSHASLFFGDAGVAVSAGTGSIAWGRNERGDTGRAGGWGAAISDEGSGYWIGRTAVAATIRARDTGERTALTARIVKAWQCREEEISRIASGSPQPDFAQMFPEVQEAAEDGDGIARGILEAAGGELASLGMIVARKLWRGGKPVAIGMTGGVFRRSPQVRRAFYDTVHRELPEVRVRLSTRPPVLGAVFLARTMSI